MHSHEHSEHAAHHHHEVSAADMSSRAFIAGIVLNSAYVIIEAAMGLAQHSMALLSDAGHNLGDVAGLVLSLIAFRLARIKPSGTFTYGYKKTTILAALANAMILLTSVGLLAYESIKQLYKPEHVAGGTMAIVAGIGIVINMGSALLFAGKHKHELNNRGAYLHLMADAAVSLGVVIAGIIIKYTNLYWLDGATSIAILIVILMSTWSLLVHSLRLTLDAVPHNLDKDKIIAAIQATAGVKAIHHVHIWGMSTSENALTAHVAMDKQLPLEQQLQVVQQIKHTLLHMDVHHSTIELEMPDKPCDEITCDHK